MAPYLAAMGSNFSIFFFSAEIELIIALPGYTLSAASITSGEDESMQRVLQL